MEWREFYLILPVKIGEIQLLQLQISPESYTPLSFSAEKKLSGFRVFENLELRLQWKTTLLGLY